MKKPLSQDFRVTGHVGLRSAIFHVVNSPPSISGICDQCGGDLYQRSDDNETSIRARLAEYKEAAPLEGYYSAKACFMRLTGPAIRGCRISCPEGSRNSVTVEGRELLPM